MEKLKQIQIKYLNTDLTPEEALKEIFNIYLITNKELELWGLTIENIDYGLCRLKEGGHFLGEGDEASCLERASEIIQKRKQEYED